MIRRIQHFFIRTCAAIIQSRSLSLLKVLLSIDSNQRMDSAATFRESNVLSVIYTTIAITIYSPVNGIRRRHAYCRE
jgi:hypothetical protein